MSDSADLVLDLDLDPDLDPIRADQIRWSCPWSRSWSWSNLGRSESLISILILILILILIQFRQIGIIDLDLDPDLDLDLDPVFTSLIWENFSNSAKIIQNFQKKLANSWNLPGSAVMFSGLSAPMNVEFLLSVTRCIKLRTICRAASVHPPYQTLWLNHPPSPPPPSSETGPQVRGRAKSGPVGRRSCNFYFSPLQVDFRFVSLPWASNSI